MKTPDEEVAQRIIQQLRTAGLLSESALKKLHPALAAGKLKAEDWRFFFETVRTEGEDINALQNQ